MGCFTKKPETVLNFISAQRGNDVLISDLVNPVDDCLLALSPPNLGGSVVNSGSVQLNWSSGVGGFEYDIYQSLSEFSGFVVIDTIVGTSLLVSGLDALTNYYFKVKYVGFGAESGFSNTISLITDQIEAPTSLVLSDIELESVQLNWVSNSEGREDGFKVQRNLTGIAPWTTITTVGTGIVTYLDDTPPLLHGTQYFYRILATSGAGDSDPSNIENATTPTMAAPSGLVASVPLLPSRIDLVWVSNSASEEDGFSIERSIVSGSGFSEIGIVGTNVLTFSDLSPLPTIEYFYRVIATESEGNSLPSNEDSATIISVAIQSGDKQSGEFQSGDAN